MRQSLGSFGDFPTVFFVKETSDSEVESRRPDMHVAFQPFALGNWTFLLRAPCLADLVLNLRVA